MLWLKALHLVAMVAWFAGLFYLPRLFVYHAMAVGDVAGIARFKVMERKLFWGIMTPAAAATFAFGGAMLWAYAWGAYGRSGWLHLKLACLVGLVAYHVACGVFLRRFARDQKTPSHVFFRVFNEVPFLFLLAIVLLAVVRPF